MAHRDRTDYNSHYNRPRRRDDDSYNSKLAGKSQYTEDMWEIYRRDALTLDKQVSDFIDLMVNENGDRVPSALPGSLCLQNPQAK